MSDLLLHTDVQRWRGGEEEEEEEEEEEGWVLGESESAKHCCHLVACEGISLIN